MTSKKLLQSETERMARVITKCFSKAALALAASEMGVPMNPGDDIFRCLVSCGKAKDFDDAVLMLAKHLDTHSEPSDDPDGDLSNGKIERRADSRRGRF